VVQVRGLLYVLVVFGWREDIGRFSYSSSARFAPLHIDLGKLQGMNGPFIEKHEPITTVFSALFNYT
jgi:hypothetical protein